VIEDSNRGKLLGHVGLYKIDKIAKKTEVGILIADDESRGKGYGSKITNVMVDYAFNTLGLHKVTAEVIKENVPSVAMFKKCGFSIDGCLRDDIYKNDRYYDVLSMSILDNERVRL
jgi:diamine N-acetyltransferase